ncbi:hypothetical protein [uncultured Clostridium sp.]|uniref:hypothetical protein n=1 Tax=uncultured Clostridium sp. TaxID=59620 RepID=UPI0027DC7F1C|nr:hypothetical protein [uncultured Clostridium sp.]
MKKKFLSLMMAAAVVATTSVSAFAAEHQLTAVGEEKQVDIGIEGKVEDGSGNVLPSTVTVTVPTALNFTVKKDGTVVSSEIEITNSGNEPVSVIATDFIDTTGENDGIKVKKEEPAERKEVNLRLVGGDQVITLTSEANSVTGLSGKMYVNNSDTATDSIVLKDITAGNPLKLKLEGKGKKSDNTGDAAVNDTFKLKLKFKKKDKN